MAGTANRCVDPLERFATTVARFAPPLHGAREKAMKKTAGWASWARGLAAAALMLGAADRPSSFGQGIATIQSGGTQAFVTGVTPVIGPNGGVGGVSVDTRGVVQLAEDVDSLRNVWVEPKEIDAEVEADVPLRMVSLRRLHERMEHHIQNERPFTTEMFFLAGLRRVEYLIAVPEQNDVLIAGPAGAWHTNQLAQTVSTKTGSPIVRLDDLAVALKSELDPSASTSCSIEPSVEGLTRFASLRLRVGGSAQATVQAMERAMGTQRVLLTGVPKGSHFAAVMVAADYWMKRYAMGFDRAPVRGMPSYMGLLQQRGATRRVTSPRWWMAPNYEPLHRSPDGLVWQLRGPGVRTFTQDSTFNSRGERSQTSEPNPLAQRWAETMTEKYDEISQRRPVFGELRNCFDLSVMAAVIAHRGLLDLAECDLPLLMDSSTWAPQFNVPTGIPSQGSFVRVKSGWAVSISGGVDMETSKVIENWNDDASLSTQVKRPYPRDESRWWW